ncbi:MAG: radical SAM family heme chaperone HemW [Coriobacteriia bacterium]|nr:radical SAM family heme chaperone HemW [Coriobacteriia bacterium]
MELGKAVHSLYIHIPFCKRRCYYCDFLSFAAVGSLRQSAYIETIKAQLIALKEAGLLQSIKTVYLGGGTPSYLDEALLEELLEAIANCVDLSLLEEYTLEANPESFDESQMHTCKRIGVNRISLGVQSFIDDELKTIGRIHDSAAARACMKMLDDESFNYSIDLMCGLPYQTLESFSESIYKALDFNLKHISIYPLTIEAGSVLDALIQKKVLSYPDDDFEADALELANKLLSSSNFERYEIASYSLPGFESKHNSAYWTGEYYIGLGLGSHSMLSPEIFRRFARALSLDFDESLLKDSARLRSNFVGTLDDYHAHSSKIELEYLSAQEAVCEDLMLSMRRSVGISSDEFDKLLEGLPLLRQDALRVFEEAQRLGLVSFTENRFMPTDKAWLLGNELFGRIWDLADRN